MTASFYASPGPKCAVDGCANTPTTSVRLECPLLWFADYVVPVCDEHADIPRHTTVRY